MLFILLGRPIILWTPSKALLPTSQSTVVPLIYNISLIFYNLYSDFSLYQEDFQATYHFERMIGVGNLNLFPRFAVSGVSLENWYVRSQSLHFYLHATVST